MTKGLTKKESKESLYTTWGRLRMRIISYSKDQRLKALAEKLNKDLQVAKIEEAYFKGGE